MAVDALGFSRPVAIPLFAVLHLVPDADDPYGGVARYRGPDPPGSTSSSATPARPAPAIGKRRPRGAGRWGGGGVR
ncbi:SAM-dependent methyltransferase [Bailinhaonella thermotolerans]|uniref:Uncharacterized protein n=1 Tax=Bailinhaonella thermotolerans TaxID=1070861 RepID=A0A3A4AEK4_9ACTN|nr:SAM-dependent methyltransferase [Bailinhaonella thermotolerans]RJL27085.1 hypothetical protein D5H75_25015 [Bailinhaonella thermotolerans]